MRGLTLICLLTLGCGHDAADAANVFSTLVTLVELPVRAAAIAHRAEDVAARPYVLCQPPRPDLSPYLRGTVVLSGPMGLDPVPFAEVTLVRDGVALRSAATDRRGVFYFSCGLAPGPYDIVVHAVGCRGGKRLYVQGPEQELLLLATPE
jgi:hypothetical protein